MVKTFLILSLLLLSSGCGSSNGYYEGSFTCKGKIGLTGTGSLSLGAGIGGAGTNAWTINGDCGDEFTISRTRDSSKK